MELLPWKHARSGLAGVDVHDIAPGLWRWTGWHEEWGQQVGCIYSETERGVCLIDPLVPPEEPARFWEQVDDLAR